MDTRADSIGAGCELAGSIFAWSMLHAARLVCSCIVHRIDCAAASRP